MGEIRLGGGRRGGGEEDGDVGGDDGDDDDGDDDDGDEGSGSGEADGDDGGDDDDDGGGGSSGSSGGKGSSSGISISSGGGGSSPATISGSGSGISAVIPNGQPFAGRSAGGGTRGLIYGTNQYGSGYPGVTGLGTAGRGFPFYFWPVVWGGAYGASYLDPTDYGSPTNTSRPRGPLATTAFSSNTSNTTFRILSDKQTVVDLMGTITSSCSSNLQTTNITATPNNDSNTLPNPDQAVQFYRASSIALMLDGYNNTADLSNGTNVQLPSSIDYTFLNCMNVTIGTTAPLVNAASGSSMSTNMIRMAPTSGLLGLVWIIWMLLFLS